MRLGIFAPYNRGEATAMAVRLAFAAMRGGWTVRWLAPCKTDRIHPYWDDNVRLATRGRVPEWSRKTDCRVWFGLDNKILRLAQSANHRAKDILVPPWHSIVAADHATIAAFNTIVCPNRPMMRALEAAFGNQGAFRVCEWPSGIKPTLRHGFLRHGSPKAILVADSHTCRHHGLDVLTAAGRLLADMPTLRLALALDLAPDRREHAALRRLMADNEDRLSAGLRVGVDTLMSEINQADWLVDASLRHGSGLLVSQARAMGVAPVAWRVNPMDGVICDDLLRGRDGLLVDCGHTTSMCGAETAEWDTDALVAACDDTLCDPHKLIRKQTYSFRRAEMTHDEIFRSFWQEALEVQTVR